MNTKISRKVLTVLVLGLILMGASIPAHAETRYVSDTLIITMRSGAGNQYRILKTLKTDTPVEVLEEEGEYLKVRTRDGTEGWVLGQYISPDTPKPIIISRLRREIAGLKSDIEKLEAERATLTSDLQAEKRELSGTVGDLEKTLSEKNDRIDELTAELKELTNRHERLVTDSQDVVSIVNERDALREQNENLTAEKEDLQKANTRLTRRAMVFWFLAGGGVFLVGWIVGQFSRSKRRRF